MVNIKESVKQRLRDVGFVQRLDDLWVVSVPFREGFNETELNLVISRRYHDRLADNDVFEVGVHDKETGRKWGRPFWRGDFVGIVDCAIWSREWFRKGNALIAMNALPVNLFSVPDDFLKYVVTDDGGVN